MCQSGNGEEGKLASIHSPLLFDSAVRRVRRDDHGSCYVGKHKVPTFRRPVKRLSSDV